MIQLSGESLISGYSPQFKLYALQSAGSGSAAARIRCARQFEPLGIGEGLEECGTLGAGE